METGRPIRRDRIGDPCANFITPSNARHVIALVFMQRDAPKAGIGTRVARLPPRTVVPAVACAVFRAIWACRFRYRLDRIEKRGILCPTDPRCDMIS